MSNNVIEQSRAYNPFLYPACRQGFVNMGLIVLFIYLGNIVRFAGNLLIFPANLIVSIIIDLMVWGYFFMYLNHCIRDSAKGGLSAPDSLPGGNGIDEIKDDLQWGLIPLACCFLPFILYSSFVENPDSLVYFLLIFCGMFVYPMIYLRSVIIGDFSALNPVAILFNIIRFLPGYLIILAGIAIVFAPMTLIYILANRNATATTLVSVPWFVYSSVVMAHFIGRFYCLRSEKLDWM